MCSLYKKKYQQQFEFSSILKTFSLTNFPPIFKLNQFSSNCCWKEHTLFMDFFMQALYNYGARKFVLFGVGQIGCSPNQLAQNSPDGRTCVARVNSANQIFNNGLRSLVDRFNNQDTDAKFIYINTYGIFQDIVTSPATYGNFPNSCYYLKPCQLVHIFYFLRF